MHHIVGLTRHIVDGRLAAFHRERIQLDGWCDVAAVFARQLLSVGLERWMLVACLKYSLFGGRMLSLFDA